MIDSQTESLSLIPLGTDTGFSSPLREGLPPELPAVKCVIILQLQLAEEIGTDFFFNVMSG